jgi:DNA/RNA endonuclease YhcR with UshA esterase domain
MQRSVFAGLAAVVLLLGLGAPAPAHHSFAAAYDMQNPVEVRGVITQVRLQNPHSWFFLEVRNASGAVEKWAFEAGTPSGMIRNGYRKDVIKEGAQVTIKGFRARDASQKMGMLRELITADGQVFGMFGPQEGPDAR